jgi:hypothetical protein
MTYQLSLATGVPDCITWNESGKPCEVWTVEQAVQLSLEMKAFIRPLISLQQHMESDIMECTTQEEVLSINIEFTEEVISDYRIQFQAMLDNQ